MKLRFSLFTGCMAVGMVLHGALTLASPAPLAAQVRHPFDPLSWQEHWTILEVLRAAGHYNDSTAIPLVTLQEPEKERVWAWRAGQELPRAALAVVKQQASTYEAVVDLGRARLVSWTAVPGVQPNWLGGEFEEMQSDVKSHPEFIEAMRRRGITDLTFIDCSGGPPGRFGLPEEDGRRLAQVGCVDARQVRNLWTRQIEGLVVVYDMNARAVLRVIDDGVVPVPATIADYDEAAVGPLWAPLPPISIAQPLGPGFELEGHSVRWQNWSFHLRPDQRVGMVLSTVRYRDGERERPILYQGYMSEIFVPYMDPAAPWYARNFLDIGEYVAGGLAKPMRAGLDCPETAVFFSQVVVEDNGRPRSVPNVICLFERVPGDVVWRHGESSGIEGRPQRDLVARMTAVLGNYDYIVDWVFQPSGAMRVLVGATGINEVKMAAPPDARAAASAASTASAGADGAAAVRADAYGRYVAENIVAVNHDHYFNFRLDLDVDGPVNRFQQDRLETQRLPDEHARRSVWVVREGVARTEREAMLSMDMHRPSLWRVVNPSAANHVGYAPSYQLVPGMNVHTLLSDDDYPRRRAGFIDHHLWVTPYTPEERYAAGMYPTLSQPGEGLPQWTAANRAIADTDIVLWYTMGMHHVARAEDWPVMPVAWNAFELRPFDFFSGNPAMRLPRRRRTSMRGWSRCFPSGSRARNRDLPTCARGCSTWWPRS